MPNQTMETWVEHAKTFGFSHAGVLNASTLTPLDAVRDMCAVDKCKQYGRCWTCPPACGSIEENGHRLSQFREGILVQTTMQLEDDFDYETMDACGKRHKELFSAFCKNLKEAGFSDILALGAGGCNLCDACTCPDAPCRHPEQALSSMEAYGLFVSDVCAKNGLGYYYGKGTMTYTGCYLIK